MAEPSGNNPSYPASRVLLGTPRGQDGRIREVERITTKLEIHTHRYGCSPRSSNFLTDRPQSVRVGNCISSTLTLSTGAPQGCVPRALLYSLYTYNCVTTSSSTNIVKFADNTAIMGVILGNNERAYQDEIKHMENWCQENNLLLNVSKTKELIVDCSNKQERHYQPLKINGTMVLQNFYTCTIESILTGNITVWFGNSTNQDRQALQGVVHSAARITHTELPDLQTIYYVLVPDGDDANFGQDLLNDNKVSKRMSQSHQYMNSGWVPAFLTLAMSLSTEHLVVLGTPELLYQSIYHTAFNKCWKIFLYPTTRVLID
ncbi:hypothetical protein P4O66_004451 [Electrophorus voltai]|uniref:Reverse transcriptase domain-containing protein n=1 Tax=Electrophorus voltai TaxID=2609070 RepID=A0AAD9E038_9TELE|nr:hypothetical protein P4O66_004451 [Electrophorus voltai]